MNFLGDDLLRWLILALGGALALGNLLALLRPNIESRTPKESDTDLPKAPLFRSILMILLGTGAAIWALASLLTS